MAGIPLPIVGGAFYAALLAMLLGVCGLGSAFVRLRLIGTAHGMALAGFTCSLGLMFLQFAVLRAFCPLCTLSAMVMGGLAFVINRTLRAMHRTLPISSLPTAIALSLFAIFPALILLTSKFAERDEVLAAVDGQKFTRKQMELELLDMRSPLQQSLYSLEEKWVEDKVEQALLAREAARVHTTVENILGRTAPGAPVSEQEVETRLRETGRPLNPEMVSEVRALLTSERQRAAREDTFRELAKSHDVQVYLEKPRLRALRTDFSTMPVLGPRGAKVQLVVVSDFECPFCKQLAPILKRLQGSFSQDVAIGFRHYPLDGHPRAFGAAVASECAAQQGAFWQYHDKLFEAGDLSDKGLIALAGSVGLDEAQFAECLRLPEPNRRVESSRREVVDAGLEGVPALFLNGLRVEGPLDYENLVRQVRESLQVASPPKTPAQ